MINLLEKNYESELINILLLGKPRGQELKCQTLDVEHFF
jgi:hypothetical protein